MSTLVKDSNGDWKQAAGNYSVWQGTRAELEAALAGGTIPNGTVALVTDDYAMQGVSCVPDWNHAVDVTRDQINAGYTCPDNGLFCAVEIGIDGTYTGTSLLVNGLVIAYGFHSQSFYDAPDVAFPVSKGDIVSVSVSLTTSYSKFVPWKK